MRGALLEDVQEYCNRNRGPQGEDLANSFRRLISETINLYPATNYGNISENEEISSKDRGLVFDCIEGKSTRILRRNDRMTNIL